MKNTSAFSNSPASELGEAVNSRAREDLAKRIKALVETNNWTQTYAAGLCGQSQPRISDILSGRLARFSIDNLLKITTVLEFHSQDFPADQRTPESVEKIIEMFRALVDSRPVKGVYALATVGSKTFGSAAFSVDTFFPPHARHRLATANAIPPISSESLAVDASP